MKKKALWILIIAILAFIIYDYVSTSQKEQAILEEAEQTTETVLEEEAVETPESKQQAGTTPEGNMKQGSAGSQSVVERGVEPGATAYDFELEDLNGNKVSLSDFRGQKVFINFWASWCPPCRVEMPHLQEFSEENEDVVILGVNVTSSESNLKNVEEFVDEYEITFPVLYGTEELSYLYQVQSLPTSYFIDSKGIVNEAVVGPVTKDILEARFAMVD